MAIVSLKLPLATRRDDVVGVIEQARFLACPPAVVHCDDDVALASDLREGAYLQ